MDTRGDGHSEKSSRFTLRDDLPDQEICRRTLFGGISYICSARTSHQNLGNFRPIKEMTVTFIAFIKGYGSDCIEDSPSRRAQLLFKRNQSHGFHSIH